MIGIVDGCKTRQSYENWLTEYGLDYKIVSDPADADGCDVMIYCGGPDFGNNPERDHLDTVVFEECKAKRIPILGVCRGMQVVSHLMGAELIEDLGELNAKHKKDEDGNSRFHPLILSTGEQWQVNSRHHQAVTATPFECSLTGTSPEGILELLVAADGSKMLVQCHPEMKEMRGTEIEKACIAFIKSKVNRDIDLLKQLYQINSKSGHEAEIKRFVLNQLEDLPLTVVEDDFGNVFITKGQAEHYPCVAAHLDEVHQSGVRNLQETDGMIFATDGNGERTGIGADDKNGVWLALRLLHKVKTLKVAFFVQEEKDGELSGCRGSRACDLAWFDNVRYILQCDRKGNSDIVTYSEKSDIRLCDDDFIPAEIRERYGYLPVKGGKTDVVALKLRGLQTPCCNLSCGYQNAHKPEEYTVVKDLLNAYHFVHHILNVL